MTTKWKMMATPPAEAAAAARQGSRWSAPPAPVTAPSSVAAMPTGSSGNDALRTSAVQNPPDTTPPTDNPTSATAYVAMLPYAYTNSDVAQLFARFGKLARVTILRDKKTRKSRGVAFVQFARVEDCRHAVARMHDTQLEGLTLACSVSRDNGRSSEFQRKRKYASAATHVSPQPHRCFECGEYGHVSYACPRNVLGTRERPISNKKLKKKKKFDLKERGHYFNDEGAANLLSPPKDMEPELSLSLLAYPSRSTAAMAINAATDPVHVTRAAAPRKHRQPASYFSDESASDSEGDSGVGKGGPGDH